MQGVGSRLAVQEEVEFFRNIYGWSDDRIERRLGLSQGTLAQRRRRHDRRAAKERLGGNRGSRHAG